MAKKEPTPEAIELARQLFEAYLQGVQANLTPDVRAALMPHWRAIGKLGGEARARKLSRRRRKAIARLGGKKSGEVRAARARARKAASSQPESGSGEAPAA